MGRSGRSLGAGGWGTAGEAEEEKEISENVGLIFLPSKTAQNGSLWALSGLRRPNPVLGLPSRVRSVCLSTRNLR